MADFKATISPLLEQMVNRLLKAKPEDPIPYIIHILEQESGEAADPLSKEEKIELKLLKEKHAKLLKVKKRQEEVKGVDQHDVASESEDDSDDYVDDLPESEIKKYQSNTARCSVSSEAYGRYYQKEEFSPIYHEKSEEAQKKIRAKLEDSFMFNHLDTKDMRTIIDAIEVKECADGDEIIKQGDDGDCLYLIGEGNLECFRKSKNEADPVLLKTYEPGEAFGELALLYNAPRAATIISKGASVLYSLDRSVFKAIVQEQAMKKRESFENALKKVKILANISVYERTQVADAIKTENFKKGDTVIKEGEDGNIFYMIMEGKAEAFKNINGEELSVLKYNEGDYFGERALIKNEPRAATVFATSDLILMKLDRKSFIRMIGPIDEILKRNMELYNTYVFEAKKEHE